MIDSKPYKYNSVILARYIIAIANDRHVPINMTKMQKLLYIAYGWYLAVKKQRLTDEHPQAWPYGPVFPVTREQLLNADLYAINRSAEEFASLNSDTILQQLMEAVFRTFGSWTASQLTAWSHGDGSPWEKTTELSGFKWGYRIPDEYIASYFNMLIRHE